MDRDTDWDRAAVESIIHSLKHEPGALTMILRRIQDELGWVPPDCVPLLAEALNLSRAEVHGVVSFYHDFRHAPPGRKVIRVCRAESCQAAGGLALEEHIKRRLGIDFGETAGDRAFTLEAVYCLGNCACSPAAVIDGELLGRLSPARFDEALARLCRAR
ncbi:MAG: formate dehydrogenase subunit gamma [Candidatus Binataceae bacterium]